MLVKKKQTAIELENSKKMLNVKDMKLKKPLLKLKKRDARLKRQKLKSAESRKRLELQLNKKKKD